MVKVSISLTQSLKTFLDEQVAARGYGDPSRYVQNLLRQAKEKAKVDCKLVEGILALESGDVIEMTEQRWQRLRAEYRDRHKKPRARKSR